MAFKICVGEADFAALRNENAYYVDKTEILYELVHDTNNKVSLFTRPRRFGKTLMMSMMENFFNIRKESSALFEGLAVARREEFCKSWMNQYPILFISFKDVEGEDFEGAYKMLQTRLADVCIELAPVLCNTAVDKNDTAVYERLKAKTATEDEIKNSLKLLMRMMHAVYGKSVILLIDEYDVPLARASEKDTSENRYYAKMHDVMRGIMSTSLKDNEFLKFAVITGCLKIAKESIFTGTNNFASYSVLDEDFSEYFGFTEREVKDILAAADRTVKEEIIREWYDGYVFGSSSLYCPWDVVNYLSALKKRPDARPKNYWRNSSHNGILLTFVKRTDFEVQGKFETLLNNGTITQTISDELTYDAIHSSEDNLWSVLLMTGYITKADPEEEGETVSLRIPNREIATLFEDTVVTLFRDTIDNGLQKTMMEAFWDGDAEGAESAISELLWKTISYNDYHEDYYHAFLAGIFTGLGYEVESNKEKGLGRPDILLKDRNHRRAIVVEAKHSKKEADLEQDCDEALRQIAKERYAEGLYGYRQILCYGVAFYKKQARVKKM